MSEDPANLSSSSSSAEVLRGREHARRDAMQEDLLRRAYKRAVHRTFIEAALRRAGLPKDPASDRSVRIRTID